MAGRPPKAPEERAVTLPVRGTEEFRRTIKSEAALRGMSMAEYLRELIDTARNQEQERRGA